MKIFIIVIFFITHSAIASQWPQTLSELPQSQQDQIKEKVSDMELYSFEAYQPTVEEHGIVSYSYKISTFCNYGQVAEDYYNITLYVNGSIIKHVTSFISFGCYED